MQFPDNFTYIPIKTSLPYKIDDIDDQQDKYKDMGITEENFADASRKAVEDMIEDISGALANR